MTDLDRTDLRTSINQLYARELEELGDRTYAMLDEARQWDLSPTLANGGVVTFAHVNVGDCGVHVAAAVNAALDTGADTLLAIGVLHAFTEEMELARRNVSSGGGAPSNHATWGIQGPGLGFRDEWEGDHSMRALRHFWEAETQRRGVKGRRLVERYPFLAGGHPENLPNLDETATIAGGAVIVSTGDQFHHGIAYGTPKDEALHMEPDGLAAARRSMQTGIDLLAAQDHAGYDHHCVVVKSDDRDAAQLYSFLRGPLQGELIDIGASDATELYDAPAPSWAAGGFIKFDPV
ncbi:MAG TPA: hypothetical protein VF115_03375 [Acidimicrobiia bacterium]